MANGILHIGLPKTGTTSFQNAVHAQRDRLLSERGMFYPSIEPNHTNALCTMFLEDPRSHITVKMRGISTLEDAEKLRREYFDAMERDIESAQWDTLVLSAEGLSNLSSSSLAQLRDWGRKYVDNWRVLFWSRHPIAYTTSVMQQLIKSGHYVEEMIDTPPLPNYRGKALNAFKAFGRSTVELTAFEDAVVEAGGVVAAFCRRLGLDDDFSLGIAASAKRENESMSMLAASILDSLNRQRPLFIDGKLNPKRRNGEVQIIQKIKGAKFDLPLKMKHRARNLSRPDVRWLNETFGTSHYQDVFDDQAAPAGMKSHPLDTEATDSLAIVMSDLINRVKG